MIARLHGTVVAKELDRVEILTSCGVAYDVAIPLGVYEDLPRVGEEVALHTHLVVRDDGWTLFGFSTPYERRVFQRLLTASGVGPSLALGMLSALSADRLVRAIRDKDLATLQGVPRVGRKTAERLVLDLADKIGGDAPEPGRERPAGTAADDAIRALVSLGYGAADAERAVRGVLSANDVGRTAPELIRGALAALQPRA